MSGPWPGNPLELQKVPLHPESVRGCPCFPLSCYLLFPLSWYSAVSLCPASTIHGVLLFPLSCYSQCPGISPCPAIHDVLVFPLVLLFTLSCYLLFCTARPPKPAIEELTDPDGKFLKRTVDVSEMGGGGMRKRGERRGGGEREKGVEEKERGRRGRRERDEEERGVR